MLKFKFHRKCLINCWWECKLVNPFEWHVLALSSKVIATHALCPCDSTPGYIHRRAALSDLATARHVAVEHQTCSYTGVKMDKPEPQATVSMNLMNAILSETTKTHKNISIQAYTFKSRQTILFKSTCISNNSIKEK